VGRLHRSGDGHTTWCWHRSARSVSAGIAGASVLRSGAGRFLNRDPQGMEGGINVYAYCTNNPVNLCDPFGLWEISIGGFTFDGEVVSEGLKTGLAAVGHVFSGGLYSGGRFRHKAGFGSSVRLAQIGDVALTAVGGIGLVSKIGKVVKLAKIASVGTVWDAIKATQASYAGLSLPRSFELLTETGRKIWVAGNGTKHIYDDAMTALKSGRNIRSVNIAMQAQLSSLRAAVSAATKGGVKYGEQMNVGGWELIFSAPRASGQFPVLYHALMKAL